MKKISSQEKTGGELEKYRSLSGKWRLLTVVLAVSLSLFHLYTSGFNLLLALKQRSFHLMLITALAFLLYPFSSRKKGGRPTAIDIMLALAGVVVTLYLIINLKTLALRAGRATLLDLTMGGILILLVLEGTRRSIGPALPIVAVAFLIYSYFGPYMPGPLAHRGFSTTRIISQLYLTTEGIFGIPIGVSSTFVFMFVLLGSFLERTGVSDYLLKLAFASLGHRIGGPAKAAVVGSGLMGMVSGSSIANTVTTGSITIPIMKRVGFKDHVAGGVEVAASTNGQFLPPIMGAAAFIMVEFTNIPYIEIVKAAFIPGVLSYIAIFSIVHLEALKTGIKGMERSELPPFWSTLIGGSYYLLPILVLLYYLIIKRMTPLSAAFWAVITAILVCTSTRLIQYFRQEEASLEAVGREFLQDMLSALEWGARNMVGIAMACACAGIIIGVVNLTGLGLRMTSLIVTLANHRLLPTLIFAMLASIILGFGLPTTATYIVMATLTAPAVARMGVPLIAAHLFVFYYGIVADDTPPVSLAAYAAAGIAHSDPVKTGVTGFKFDLSAFILPFIFVYSPTLLMVNATLPTIIMSCLTAIIGMYALSASIQNYFLVKTSLPERAGLFAVAILLITPNLWQDLLGFAGFILIYLLQTKKRETSRPSLSSPG